MAYYRIIKPLIVLQDFGVVEAETLDNAVLKMHEQDENFVAGMNEYIASFKNHYDDLMGDPIAEIPKFLCKDTKEEALGNIDLYEFEKINCKTYDILFDEWYKDWLYKIERDKTKRNKFSNLCKIVKRHCNTNEIKILIEMLKEIK